MTSEVETSTNLESKEPAEPLGFLGYIRAKVADRLGPKDAGSEFSHDIEQSIRGIRALLSTNEEIFERCMQNATSCGETTTLDRFGFDKIITLQTTKDSNLELVTQPERAQEKFDTSPLSTLPQGLEDALVVKYKGAPFASFIDYDDLFRKALMFLHEDALEMFLVKLKDQLELVQVCLGEIDAWVMQSDKNVSFIDTLFGKELKIPDDIDPLGNSCKCCYCQGETSYNCSTYYCSHIKCKSVIVLTECSVSGSYHTAFDLSLESEQARLQRFLYFLCG